MTQTLICLLTLLFSLSSPAMKGNAGFWQSSLAAEETQITLNQGSLINRVWDSRWAEGEQYSQPMGGSFSPEGALPINANVAIETRGLSDIPEVINNAQQGGVFSVTTDIPATLKTSIGGTEPELYIQPQYRQYLNLIEESRSTIPAGGHP
jgi:hypothetical protein